jgi:hypothetical protein
MHFAVFIGPEINAIGGTELRRPDAEDKNYDRFDSGCHHRKPAAEILECWL